NGCVSIAQGHAVLLPRNLEERLTGADPLSLSHQEARDNAVRGRREYDRPLARYQGAIDVYMTGVLTANQQSEDRNCRKCAEAKKEPSKARQLKPDRAKPFVLPCG